MGKRKAHNFIDETGNKYERLTVIKEAGRDKHNNAMWLCRCTCGREVVVRGVDLRSGSTKSCGCLNLERIIERNSTLNGLCKKHPRRHQVWRAINQRCNNPDFNRYEDYGAKGIKVDPRWHEDNPEGFANFIADTIPAKKAYEYHRLDSNEGYFKWNLVYISCKLHREIHAGANFIGYCGIVDTQKGHSRRLGGNSNLVCSRIIKFGYSEQEAVSIPVGMTREQYYKQLEN